MVKKAAALFLVCASMAIWVSCGSTSGHYLYVAVPGSNEIVVYREDPNSGILTELVGSPVTAGQAVESIAIHPSGKFLCAANSGEGDVSIFTIAPNGGITEITPRTVVGTAPTLAVMDPAGAYLYVGNSGSYNISVFAINSTGTTPTLTQVTGSPFPIGMSPINMEVSPSGGFLYITGAGTSSGSNTGYIEVFSLSSGILTALPSSPFTTAANPYGIAIDATSSNGSFLYTANNLDGGSISEFTINADGSLTQFANSPFGSPYPGPFALLIDKTGSYMYVANQASTFVTAYSIGSGGALTGLTSSPFSTGPEPSVLATDPGGKYLFVGNQKSGSATIQSFSLDPSTGTLTSVATYKLPGPPSSLGITP
jgi:6-phosphogluconolactonase